MNGMKTIDAGIADSILTTQQKTAADVCLKSPSTAVFTLVNQMQPQAAFLPERKFLVFTCSYEGLPALSDTDGRIDTIHFIQENSASRITSHTVGCGNIVLFIFSSGILFSIIKANE